MANDFLEGDSAAFEETKKTLGPNANNVKLLGYPDSLVLVHANLEDVLTGPHGSFALDIAIFAANFVVVYFISL